MDRKKRDKWVEALRSGEFAQCKRRLKREGDGDIPDSYCCLGVLLEHVDERDLKTLADYSQDNKVVLGCGGARCRYRGDVGEFER